MHSIRRSVLLIALLALSPVVFAATFVVPSDRDLVRRADAIVVGTPLSSFTQINDAGGIETVTSVQVEEVLKGQGLGETLTIVEPGGEHAGSVQFIPGVPRFNTSERSLFFLSRTGSDRWAVSELALGKFTFRQGSGASAMMLLRDANDITGWNPDLTPHQEAGRDATRFLNFVRNESRGTPSAEDYFVAAPARIQSESLPSSITPNVAPYSATSYTMTISGSEGSRWSTFPSAVTFYSGTTQEPGAPGGGSTAITAAFASWNNDASSNVNYAYGGTDNGTHTQGLHATDGANTILFERDLSSWGVSPFSCSGTGYSGVLGIGGITSASGSNSVNGETFVTTREADVEMNRGLANCTLLFGNGDFNSAVTHETGHTLGFRHSDQTRDSSASCTTDPSLECSQQAIMKSFISTGLNGALQTYDQHAVQAIYPGSSCSLPVITGQPQSVTINSGSQTTLTVTATGSGLTYQYYFGASGNTASPIAGATGPALIVAPGTPTSYWVRVSNACGSVNSATATVTVNSSCTVPVITAQPQSATITSGGQTTLRVTATGAGLTYQFYFGASGNTASPIAGATGPALIVAPGTTTSYWVRVSNSCGSVNSATATITVSNSCAVPVITVQPQSVTINAGGQTTLMITASGTGLSYQYYFGASGNTASPIAGATGPALIVAPGTTTSYWIRVSNSCGSVNSATATVTVNCATPSITAQPQSVTINSGGQTTLKVTATGSGLTYQYYFGTSGNTASPITGATGPALIVAPGTTTSYWVRVSSACGSVNSATATVTVNTSCTVPIITGQPQSATISSGSQWALGVNATGSGLTYQWYVGTSGNTSSPISGATQWAVGLAPATTTSYWARVSSACGSVNSATATITVH